MARGAFPDSHPLASGMPGMHGNYTAVTAMQRADLLVALGARFDDRVTGKIGAFAPDAKVIHVDIDPAELGKVRGPDVGIAGDCRLVIEELLRGVMDAQADRAGRRRDLVALVAPDRRVAGALPAPLRPQETVMPSSPSSWSRAARRYPRRHHRRGRRRPAPDVGVAVLELRPPLHLGQLRRGRDHGLRRARRHRRQGGPPRPDGVGHRRRRVLPDDRPGAGHRQLGADPGQGRHLEQRLSRHGAPVAGDVLRGALLRGVPVAGPARLREVGRGHGLRRHPGRDARGGGAGHREGQRHRRPPGGHRLPHRRLREGVPDGARRRLQRRHRGAPGPGAAGRSR